MPDFGLLRARHQRLAAVVALLVAAPLCSMRAAANLPADGWLTWTSNRLDGRHEIYLMQLGTGNPIRLSHKGAMYPIWSPDGRWIAYYDTADKTTRVMRWYLWEDKEIADGVPEFWMHDNSGLVVGKPASTAPRTSFYLVDPDTGASQLLFNKDDFQHLTATDVTLGGITHDGRWLVAWVYGLFGMGYTAENGTFKSNQSTVVLDLTDKSKLYFFGPGCNGVTPPAGEWIYHVSREGATMPDIFKMQVADLLTRSSYGIELGNDDSNWGHEYMPRISNDNKWLVYGASTGCHNHETCDYEIFVHQLGSGPQERTQVTFHQGNDSYPSLYVGQLWTPGAMQDGGIADAAADQATGDAGIDQAAADAAVDQPTDDASGDQATADAAVDQAAADASADGSVVGAAIDGATEDGAVDASSFDPAGDGSRSDRGPTRCETSTGAGGCACATTADGLGSACVGGLMLALLLAWSNRRR